MKTREIEDIASMDNVPKDLLCVFVSLFNQLIVKIYSFYIFVVSIRHHPNLGRNSYLYSIKPVLSGVQQSLEKRIISIIDFEVKNNIHPLYISQKDIT